MRLAMFTEKCRMTACMLGKCKERGVGSHLSKDNAPDIPPSRPIEHAPCNAREFVGKRRSQDVMVEAQLDSIVRCIEAGADDYL